MSVIKLSSLTKLYSDDIVAVDDISMTVNSGEFMVLVGPSGCGKSTLMRMIAGLEIPTAGRVEIGERDVTGLTPRHRDVAMVFQNYALYPHMTVRKNLGYGLKVRGTPKPEIVNRVQDVASLLGLEALLERRPAALSGGQRQRVAMGRAIVREPEVFLMDEPLSNLDAKLRVSMRGELARLHERLGVTTIYVTHDQVEAMTLGQRVAVMRDGRIDQVAPPHELYLHPKNLYVAAFIGSPAMNLVYATIKKGRVHFAGFELPLGEQNNLREGEVILGIRPEAFEDARFSDPGLPTLDVVPSVLELLGSDVNAVFPLDAPRVELEALGAAVDEGDEGRLFVSEQTAMFTARIDPRTSARQGSQLRLTVKPESFHLFDADTGEAITGAPTHPLGPLAVGRTLP